MMRYIWAAVSNKESLWVKWINERYLTGNSIWTLHIPCSCSWALRSILQVRSLAIHCIKHMIGNGSNTLLWLDPWHPRGVLRQALGEHVAYTLNSSRMATVASIREGNRWRTTRPRPTSLIPVWEALHSITTLHESEDAIVWTPSQTGIYTLKSAYQQIRTPGTIQPWHSQIWFKGAIPRYSFIAWLLYKGRLTTLDRLCQKGILQDDICRLCQQAPESVQHLFFQCTYTLEVWGALLQKCSINRVPTDWTNEQTWLSTALAGGQPKHTARKIAFTATVYHIWTERNNRIFRGTNKSTRQLISAITAAVKCKLAFLYPQAQDTAENRATLGTWGITAQYKISQPTWIKPITPKPGDITLHTDASLCQGRAGLGYILRNDQGEPILAGTAAVTPSHSILLHEMQAILRGLKTTITFEHTCNRVYSDSKVAIDIINGKATAPWICWPTLSRIRDITSKYRIQFCFVHRQANQVADYLTHASNCINEEDTIWMPGEMPQQLLQLVARDKQQHPYLRT